MDSYTGKEGKEDLEIRKTGQSFWVFEDSDVNLTVIDCKTKALELIKEGKWEGWLHMKAIDEQSAKELYYDAQDQWRDKGG